MDWLDLLIIILLIATVVRGLQLGLVRQFGSAVGFIGGLFLGAYAGDKLLNHFAQTAGARAFFTVLLTLGFAMVLSNVGEYLGELLKYHMPRLISRFDEGIGGIVGGVTLLTSIWLAATLFVNLPSPTIQTQVHDSAIISALDKNLPTAPNIIARIGHLIVPDNFPQVFNGVEPNVNTATSLPSLGSLDAVIQKDEPSVIKVEGRGCGGLVEGSGFVASTNEIITNAHVVAGIASPYVITQKGTFPATVVWFDPNVDLAILRVSGLSEAPLTIVPTHVANGTAGAVLGYPGGGPFDAVPAAVLQDFTAEGRNIYDQGETTRDVYSIKATVIPGNSGGPLINKQGAVIGIVFAQSTTYNQVGYALTTPQFVQEYHAHSSATQGVSTGECAE
jgi:S1-C subfamily serine protease